MNNKGHIIAEIIMAVVILLLLFSLRRQYFEGGTETHSDTVVVIKYDTLPPIEKPIWKTRIVLDTVYLTADTNLVVEQKTYSDSISTIWVSGIDPNVDSIRYTLPKEYITINTTTTNTIVKKKHWSQFVGVGLSGGYGVSINQTPTFSPFVGVTVTYGFGYTW